MVDLRNLELERPLVFVDTETTGVNVRSDRIVELCCLKLNPDGTQEDRTIRVNPGIPIPPSATAIHHITDADVANEPPFGQFASSLCDFLDDCDLAGFNITGFDLPLLEAEFGRAGIEFSRKNRHLLDAQTIFHKKEPRDLSAAYEKYCGSVHEEAHTAAGDVRATVEILDGQLKAYPELPRTVGGLHSFCNPDQENWVDEEGRLIWANGEAVFSFGKHKGRSLRQVASSAPDYLQWIMGSDFSVEVKAIARDAMDGSFPEYPAPA